MGCGNTKTEEQNKNNKEQRIDPNVAITKIPFLDVLTATDNKFRDMPDSPTGRFVGKGIKRIPNYICILPYDKLDILREQFWMTRNKSDFIWEILQECCEIDEIQAEQLLKTNNIVCLEGDLRETYSKEQPNFVYHIPNFCVADPFFEKNFEEYEKIYDEVDDMNIKVNILYQNENKRYAMKIRNKCTGFDFKHKFAKMIKLDKKCHSLRLFYRGQEILDTHCVYYHNVTEDALIYIVSFERSNGTEFSIKWRKNKKKQQEITSETEKIGDD